MANMSYCRFQNTANDLRDCFHDFSEETCQGESMDAVDEYKESLSEDEKYAFERLEKIARDFIEMIDEAKNIGYEKTFHASEAYDEQ